MATVITVTANALLNFTCTERISCGQVNRVSQLRTVAEGKGINVGRVLTAHGHRVIACGFAGGETGALFRQHLAELGLEDALTPTAARLRSGFMDGGDAGHHPTTILEHGFAVSAAEVAALADAVTAQLAAADLVIVCGSVPDPLAAPAYATMLLACGQRGIPCWVDSYGPGMDAALNAPPAPSLAKPNREELARNEGWQRCAELHITNGPAAIEVQTAELRLRVTPPPVTEVNPIGSGDCYLGALAHARLSGMSLEDQLRYASAAGAANAARADVAAITPAEIEALCAASSVAPA